MGNTRIQNLVEQIQKVVTEQGKGQEHRNSNHVFTCT